GHDGDIVRVGEGRHHGVRGAEIAVAGKRADRRKDALGYAAIEIFGIASVDADDHRRALRLAVPPAVELDRLGHWRSFFAWQPSTYRGKFSRVNAPHGCVVAHPAIRRLTKTGLASISSRAARSPWSARERRPRCGSRPFPVAAAASRPFWPFWRGRARHAHSDNSVCALAYSWQLDTTWPDPARALAATQVGEGLDRRAGFPEISAIRRSWASI